MVLSRSACVKMCVDGGMQLAHSVSQCSSPRIEVLAARPGILLSGAKVHSVDSVDFNHLQLVHFPNHDGKVVLHRNEGIFVLVSGGCEYILTESVLEVLEALFAVRQFTQGVLATNAILPLHHRTTTCGSFCHGKYG